MSMLTALTPVALSSREAAPCRSRRRRAAVTSASSCPSLLERIARTKRASRFYDGPALKRMLQPWVPPPSFPRDPVSETRKGGGLVLFDGADPETRHTFAERWGTIDDWLVGGCSISSVQLLRSQDAGLVLDWHGVTSAATSFGWASARMKDASPAYNLTPFDGISLRVCGDGQRYKLALRCEQGLMAPTWESAFDTIRDEWTTVRLPFASFVPFGWRHSGADSRLRLHHVTGVQLLISAWDVPSSIRPGYEADDQGLHVSAPHHRHHGASDWMYGPRNPLFGEGPFQLWVQRIEAYKKPHEEMQLVPVPPPPPQATAPLVVAKISSDSEVAPAGGALEAQFKAQWAAEEDRLADSEGLSHVE
jgi:hypothetical protein